MACRWTIIAKGDTSEMTEKSGHIDVGKEIASDQSMGKYWETTAPPDWSVEFKEGEWEKLEAWYSKGHGFGSMKLDRFAPMMYKLRPDTVKRYRLYLDSVGRGYPLRQPTRAIVPLAMHYYIVERYAEGIEYAITGTRRMGMSKQQVGDIFALAWFHTGPPVINTLARFMDDYMDLWGPDWEGGDKSPGFQWDPGWAPDPEAFACGIDFSVPRGNELRPGELEMIEEWHRRVEGDVPAYVRHAAKHYPLQLLSYRARYETTVRGSLPKQYIALARLMLAAAWQQTKVVRRAMHMARHFGVARDQVVQVLALDALFLSDIGIDSTYEAVHDILEDWPEAEQSRTVDWRSAH